MAWYTSRREDQQDTIYIFFSDEENVAKKTVRKSVLGFSLDHYPSGTYSLRFCCQVHRGHGGKAFQAGNLCVSTKDDTCSQEGASSNHFFPGHPLLIRATC